MVEYDDIPTLAHVFDNASEGIDFLRRGANVVSKIAAPSLAQDEEPSMFSKIAGIPVGFQFGTYFGIKDPMAALAVDMVTDPTNYLNFFGGAATRSFFGLTNKGVAAASDVNAYKQIRKLGVAVDLSQGINTEEKIGNMKKIFELGETLHMDPALAERAKAGLNAYEEVVNPIVAKYNQLGQPVNLKELRKALGPVDKHMQQVVKEVLKATEKTKVAKAIFSKGNIESFKYLLEARAQAMDVGELGVGYAEQISRGQRSMFRAFLPFAHKPFFEVTGQPLFGVGGKLPDHVQDIFSRPSGLANVDNAAQAAVARTPEVHIQTISFDELEKRGQRMFEDITEHSIADHLTYTGEEPGGVLKISNPLSRNVEAMIHTDISPQKITHELNMGGDYAETYSAIQQHQELSGNLFWSGFRDLVHQTYGPRVGEAKLRMMGEALQDVADPVTGLNQYGMRVEEAEYFLPNGKTAKYYEFLRPDENISKFSGDMIAVTNTFKNQEATVPELINATDTLKNNLTQRAEAYKRKIDVSKAGGKAKNRALAKSEKAFKQVTDAIGSANDYKFKAQQIEDMNKKFGLPPEHLVDKTIPPAGLTTSQYSGLLKIRSRLQNEADGLKDIITKRLTDAGQKHLFGDAFDTVTDIKKAHGRTFLTGLNAEEIGVMQKGMSDVDLKMMSMFSRYSSGMGQTLQERGLIDDFITQYAGHFIEPTLHGKAAWAQRGEQLGAKGLPVSLESTLKVMFFGGQSGNQFARSILMPRKNEWEVLRKLEAAGEIRVKDNLASMGQGYATAFSKVMRMNSLMRAVEQLGSDGYSPMVVSMTKFRQEKVAGLTRRLLAQGFEVPEVAKEAANKQITHVPDELLREVPPGQMPFVKRGMVSGKVKSSGVAMGSYVFVPGLQYGRVAIREDVAKMFSMIDDLDTGTALYGSVLQGPDTKLVRALQSLNATAKRGKLMASLFHAWALTGSFWGSFGLNNPEMYFDKATGGFIVKKGEKLLLNGPGGIKELDKLPAEAEALMRPGGMLAAGLTGASGKGLGRVGAVQGALAGTALGAAVSDQGNEQNGAMGGAVVGTFLGFAFGTASAAAQIGRKIYGEGADIIYRGVRGGLKLNGPDMADTDMLERAFFNAQQFRYKGMPLLGGKATEFVGKNVLKYDRWLWNEYYAGMKSFTFAQLYATEMAKNMNNGLKLNGDQIAANVAAHTNTLFGGVMLRKFGANRGMNRLLNMLVFAPDWTITNIMMARDVFMNMSYTKSALVGATLGGATQMALDGFEGDSPPWGAVIAGATGGVGYKALSHIWGERFSRDIIKGTPLDRIHISQQADPKTFARVMGSVKDAWREGVESGKLKFANPVSPEGDFRSPEFLDYFVKHTSDELSRKKLRVPDGFLDSLIAPQEGSEMRARLSRDYAKRAGIAYITMVSMANFAFTGHFPWENAEGHKHEIELPFADAKGRKHYMSLGKQFKEPFEWVDDPAKRFASKTSLGFRTGMDILKNGDFMGKPIYAHNDGFIASWPLVTVDDKNGVDLHSQLIDVAGYAANQAFLPATLEKVRAAIGGEIDPRRAVVESLGWQTGVEFARQRGHLGRPPRIHPIAPSLVGAPPLAKTSLKSGEY